MPAVAANTAGCHEPKKDITRTVTFYRKGGGLSRDEELKMDENTQLEKPGYWAILPAPVRYDPELPPMARILYAEISSLIHFKGYCFASNDYFAGILNCSKRSICRLLGSLEERGYIRIEDATGGKNIRKVYAAVNPFSNYPEKYVGVLRPEEAETKEPADGSDPETPTEMTGFPPHDKIVVGATTKLSIPHDKNVTHNKKENRKKNNPPKAPQGAGADFVPKEAPDWKPDRFSRFWKFYPLHKSKQAAIRAWDRLKPSDELLAVIGKALKRQIAEKKTLGEEWKIYASTYLNNARWTDEPDEHPGTGEEDDGEWL